MEKLVIFAGMSLATYFTRYTMIALLGRELSPLIERWLSYVPPAVLAAMIAPALLAPQGQIQIGSYVWAGVAALPVAWRTRKVLPTIVFGMMVYWGLRWLGL